MSQEYSRSFSSYLNEDGSFKSSKQITEERAALFTQKQHVARLIADAKAPESESEQFLRLADARIKELKSEARKTFQPSEKAKIYETLELWESRREERASKIANGKRLADLEANPKTKIVRQFAENIKRGGADILPGVDPDFLTRLVVLGESNELEPDELYSVFTAELQQAEQLSRNHESAKLAEKTQAVAKAELEHARHQAGEAERQGKLKEMSGNV